MSAGTEVRIDYDLAQRYAAARRAGQGKRLCTEGARTPRLPYQEQLMRQGVTMDQMNDTTYWDVRWHAPPALASVQVAQSGAAAEGAPHARDRGTRGHTGSVRAMPARGGPERGRKRRNTVSRWDGGAGAPGQDVTAAGRMARADGMKRGGEGAA